MTSLPEFTLCVAGTSTPLPGLIHPPFQYCAFKLAYTTRVFNYQFQRNISSVNFINNLSENITRDFGLNQFNIVDVDYHFYNRNYSGRAEEAPPININDIYEKIQTTNRNNLTFYVKPIQDGISLLVNILENPPQENRDSLSSLQNNNNSQCMLCFEYTACFTYFGCRHIFCNDCNSNFVRYNNRCCPICRHEA